LSAQPVITLDIDWAPDYAIDFAAALLIEAQVRATWFVTHDSPAVGRLRQHPHLFELGIHPNFLPGTTHGKTESEILSHCMGFLPQARVVRSHGLVQSSNLLEKIIDETRINVDVSLFLPHAAALEPVVYYWEGRKRLVRLPYMWEDDFEMVRPDGIWDLGGMIDRGTGLMIMDFHPIHVYLNSMTLATYRSVQAMGRLVDLPEEVVRRFIETGRGAGYAFRSAIERMQRGCTVFLQEFSDMGHDRGLQVHSGSSQQAIP
jgi:hypothetical protein